jgi:hypothetical protein
MTIVHRNKVNKATNTANAAPIPNLSVRLPEPVHTTNSYSALDSNKSAVSDSVSDSTSEEVVDKVSEYTWKDAVSEKSDSDYDDMPPLIDEAVQTSDEASTQTSDESNDVSNDVSDESDETSDENTYISEQDEDFVSDKTSDEESSEDDIIVAHAQYRRVRTDKRCKDGIPYAIQLAFFFFALAQFMQLVFLICKSVPHRHCISDPF